MAFAGRGVVHSEMPYGDEETGFLQLWVNLKSSEKMCEPAYQVIVRYYCQQSILNIA